MQNNTDYIETSKELLTRALAKVISQYPWQLPQEATDRAFGALEDIISDLFHEDITDAAQVAEDKSRHDAICDRAYDIARTNWERA